MQVKIKSKSRIRLVSEYESYWLICSKAKDYYKKQGLDVEIIQPGDNVTAEQMIASGKADFAISAQENVTLARVEGIPVVSVGAIIQHNTSAFASLKKII